MLTLFSGRITEVPSIVISLEALRPPLIQGVDPELLLEGMTPGVRFASAKGLRPLSGRSRICLPWITVETLDVEVDNWTALALTSTVVATFPTFKANSSETVCFTSTVRR